MIEDFDGASEEDLKGVNVNAPGYFHVYIGAEGRNEKNDAAKVDFEVLAGTAKGQEGRRASHFFQDPSPAHKDGGKFCRAMKTRLYLVTGLMHASQLGQKVRVDSAQLVGRQAIVKLKVNEKGFAEIEGQEIFSVFDPAMNHVPKDAKALEIAKQMAGQGAGAQQAQTQSAAPLAAPSASAASAVAPQSTLVTAVAPAVANVAPAAAAAGADPWAAL